MSALDGRISAGWFYKSKDIGKLMKREPELQAARAGSFQMSCFPK